MSEPSTPPRIQGALFDMDGLLLDTESIYTEVTQTIVGRFGKVFDWSIKGNMIGRPAMDSARYLVEALELPITAEAYLEEREALLRAGFTRANPMPGAERLVKHFQQHGIKTAVATSSSRELFELKTAQHPWFSDFDAVVTGDHPEIKHGKPAPDIFHLAAAAIGLDASACFVFEDAPSGLAAGLAAGSVVIVVPDPGMDASRFTGAHKLLKSLADFDPSPYNIPPLTD